MTDEYNDVFEIVDGPEDGVSFPVMRTPVMVGASVDCGIFINFDKKVLPDHARVTVVSGGYRIRSVSGEPVYINEKRSGMVWARTARSGDIIRVGDTSLNLICAPDGLASRSIGMPTESNVVWLLRALVDKGLKTATVLYRLVFKMLGRVNRFLLLVVVGGLILAWLQPALLRNLIAWGRFYLQRCMDYVSSLL